MYLFIETIGTVAFAIAGAMVAIERKMDILGVIILAITTATGGGIIRDVLIGSTPPYALLHPRYAIIATFTAIAVFIPRVRSHVNVDSKFLVLVDAVGMGMFTTVGCQTALSFNNVWMQVFLGVLTGVGGGALRDIFAAQRPMIFVKHFYASASLIGAIAYTVIYPYNEDIAVAACVVLVVVLRMLAAKYKWHLPKA